MKKFKITNSQLSHIIAMADDMEAMIGGADEQADKDWQSHVDSVDRMLTANGYARKHKQLPPSRVENNTK